MNANNTCLWSALYGVYTGSRCGVQSNRFFSPLIDYRNPNDLHQSNNRTHRGKSLADVIAAQSTKLNTQNIYMDCETSNFLKSNKGHEVSKTHSTTIKKNIFFLKNLKLYRYKLNSNDQTQCFKKRQCESITFEIAKLQFNFGVCYIRRTFYSENQNQTLILSCICPSEWILSEKWYSDQVLNTSDMLIWWFF